MSYVVAGYGLTALTLAAYTLRLLRRGRGLTRTLPPEERRWR